MRHKTRSSADLRYRLLLHSTYGPKYLQFNVNVTIITPPKDRFEREIWAAVKKEGVSITTSSSSSSLSSFSFS